MTITPGILFSQQFVSTTWKELVCCSRKNKFIKWEFTIGLNQRVSAGEGWGCRGFYGLATSRLCGDIQETDIQQTLEQKIHLYIHECMCTHKIPLWIYENPEDEHRLVFISIWTEKICFIFLFLDTEKHQHFLGTSWNIFIMCLAQLFYAPREFWKYWRLMELLERAVAWLCPEQQTEEHFQCMLKIQILSQSLESRCQLWITWLLCHIFLGYAHWLR